MSSYPPPPPIPPELRERARPDRPTPKPTWGATELAGYASAFGFIGTVLVFGVAGWGIDALAGTGPWGVIVSFLLGLTGSTIKMVRENSRAS